jgi:hypothetical protein
LPTAAPVPPLSPLEFFVDRLDVDGEPSGKAINESDQSGAVRFAGSPITKHGFRRGRERGESSTGKRILVAKTASP